MPIRSIVALLAFGIAACPVFVTAQTLDRTPPLQYTALPTPCRAVDTRVAGGAIAAGTSQNFNPAGGACNIPIPSTGPIVYALNVTVLPDGPLGYVSVWPTGATQPLVSTLNSPDGRVKANAALATGGNGGEISVYASDKTDLVLDVSGYFTNAPAAYVYVPVTPCRVVDTRINNGTSFGAPSLVAGQQRTFPLANGSCNLPATAFAKGGALSLNVTAVPIAGQPVSYVTVWGKSPTEPQTPVISTLNVPTGTMTANASLVTINRSTSESVSVYSSDSTDLVLDITGYFAPASLAPSGLSLYTLPPCRVIDTRESSGEFQGELTVPFTTGNNCSIPTNAQAYVVNATVVPSGPLGFLTLWPDGIPQPLVSTLNAEDGSVTSNMAIVSTRDGSIDTFASSDTQLILDVSGYFASPPGPTVVFVGDQVTVDMFTPTFQAQHPTWVNAGVVGETTAQALAAFQAQCISLHPQVCHVMIGLNDIQAWLPYPPGDEDSQEVQVLQDLSQMLQEATAAGIQVVFATEFPSFEDFEPNDLEPPVEVYDTNINAWLTGFADNNWPSDWPPAPTAAVIANYWAPLTGNCDLIVDGTGGCDYLPGLSTDDIVPNAAGYAVMYPVLASTVQQALSSTPSSSAKPTMPLTNKAEKADF